MEGWNLKDIMQCDVFIEVDGSIRHYPSCWGVGQVHTDRIPKCHQVMKMHARHTYVVSGPYINDPLATGGGVE